MGLRLRPPGVGPVALLGRTVEQLEEALRARLRVHQPGEGPRQALERLVALVRHQEEGHQVARTQSPGPAQQQPGAEQESAQGEALIDDVDQRARPQAVAGHPHRTAEELARLAAEGLLLGGLAAEGLDHLDAVEDLEQSRAQLGELLLTPQGAASNAAPAAREDPEEQGTAHECQERQAPGDGHQEDGAHGHV